MAQRRRLLPDNALLARTEARRRRACSACARAACTSSFSCAPHQRLVPPPSTASAGHRARGLLAAQGTQGIRTVHAVRLATKRNGVAEVCVRSLGEPRGKCWVSAAERKYASKILCHIAPESTPLLSRPVRTARARSGSRSTYFRICTLSSTPDFGSRAAHRHPKSGSVRVGARSCAAGREGVCAA
jgi:hypothetical protein